MKELIDILTSQLGVNEEQAKGGAGILFELAKDKLGGADFSKISDAVGGVDEALAAVPKDGGGIGGLLGGLASKMGADGLGDVAELAGKFKGLDLDVGMIGKFVDTILDFVQGKGGDLVKGLLAGVLKK